MMLDVLDVEIAALETELVSFTGSVDDLFSRPEPRVIFHDLIAGLLSDLPKKNGWTIAERSGHSQPGRIQTFLSRGAWSAAALEAAVRERIVAGLGDPEGVLIVDDTQVIKKGTKSVGVAPQHCGATNQTENCQVAVMLSYATQRGHAFIGHRLYLPERWTSDRERCREAGIPDSVGFVTKPAQAVELIEEAIAAGVPFGWVAMDGGYGQYATVRHALRERGLRYVAAVPSSFPLVHVHGHEEAGQPTLKRADDLLKRVTEQRWERRSCGEGSKGQRFYDWALFEVDVNDDEPADGFAHFLLIRRSVSNPDEISYFLVHAPTATTMTTMVACAGLRWKIEEDNRAGKQLTGLNDYQVRTWTAWHHQITACMFAHAFLVLARAGIIQTHNPGTNDPEESDESAAGKAPATLTAPAGSP